MGLELGVESIGFDIASGYASSPKVPPAKTWYESKWQSYAEGLAPLKLPPADLSRFLEKVCAPPCKPGTLALDGWKLILPCLTKSSHWDLPVACWNETEKALHHDARRPVLLRGLQLLSQECPEHVAAWLRLSPHNLCRTARRLGLLTPEKSSMVMNRARSHPVWWPLGRPYRFQRISRVWGPLHVPDWLSEGLARDCDESLAQEFCKRQPLLQLDLLYRLLKS